MANTPAGDKTEEPTAKRLKEARDRGQIARSPDISSWLTVLVATWVAPPLMGLAGERFDHLLDEAAVNIARPDPERALNFLGEGLWTAIVMAAPLALVMMVVGIVANVVQVGWHPSRKRLTPRFSAVNPVQGFKRMFSTTTLWFVAKSVFRLVVLAGVALSVVQKITARLSDAGRLSFESSVGLIARETVLMTRHVAFIALLIAGVDYLVQRRKTGKQLRMTKQEVKDERRQSDGDPKVKGAIRARQYAMSRNRMMAEVAGSNVVVVNPTHVAVALKYDLHKGAPVVVAKGMGAVAARIRAEAEEHGVPVVQDVALARTLNKVCQLGDEIPTDLYDAVARLLAFVFTLRAAGRPLRGELKPPAPLLDAAPVPL